MILPFALLFTIGLAVILLLGAIIIWKSDLPANDKLVSLLIIMALFAAVSVVNEAKRANAPKIKQPFSTGEFEKAFYTSPAVTPALDLQSPFPQLHNDVNLIEESLEGWNPVNSTSYSLAFLYSEKDSGVSSACKKLVQRLQAEKVPVLYLSLKHSEFSMLDFITALKVADIAVVDKAVEKLNRENKIPTIIVDNAENALTYDETPSNKLNCPVCKYLVSLYDAHKINIILLSNDARAKDYLQADYSLISKMSFYELKETGAVQLEQYLVNTVNEKIEDSSKRFKADNVRRLHETLGWNFGLLGEYLQNITLYTNVNDFVQKKIQTEANRVAGYSELWDLLNCLVTLTEDKKDNAWIPYSRIRKVYEGNPARKLDDALNADILVKENNLYRFTNATVYNAVLAAKENKLLKR